MVLPAEEASVVLPAEEASVVLPAEEASVPQEVVSSEQTAGFVQQQGEIQVQELAAALL